MLYYLNQWSLEKEVYMQGQWLGNYKNLSADIDANGSVTVNIDELKSCYRGVINIIPKDIQEIPAAVGYFTTTDKNFHQAITIKIKAIDPQTLLEAEWGDIQSKFPNYVVFSNELIAQFEFKNKTLSIIAKSDAGINIETKLIQPNHNDSSRIDGLKMNWSDFKEYVSSLARDTYFFRGQKKPWKLQTSFHRRERYCLDSYLNFDVPKLHKRLSSLTKHYFNLQVPEQNGAFFNLLQHHGYPTPLLDWSHSPYVSAFFAFRDWEIGYQGSEDVRIYIFNSAAWQKYTQFQILNPPIPHLSIMDFVSMDNQRIVPQQAITTVTNISDIEHYLLSKGDEMNTDFIVAIDIPAKEREMAMQDLRYMGITAGSMFPGLDGACEEMKEMFFDK